MKNILLIATLISSISPVLASNAKCNKRATTVSSKSKLYTFLDNIAELHVYYDSIEGRKVKPIKDVTITRTCKNEYLQAHEVKFTTYAKVTPRSKERLFYCVARVILDEAASPAQNQSAFCSLDKNELSLNTWTTKPTSSSSNNQEHSRNADFNTNEDEFNRSQQDSGFDVWFDEFSGARENQDDSPDSRGQTGDI
jgi:hypothetical protein